MVGVQKNKYPNRQRKNEKNYATQNHREAMERRIN